MRRVALRPPEEKSLIFIPVYPIGLRPRKSLPVERSVRKEPCRGHPQQRINGKCRIKYPPRDLALPQLRRHYRDDWQHRNPKTRIVKRPREHDDRIKEKIKLDDKRKIILAYPKKPGKTGEEQDARYHEKYTCQARRNKRQKFGQRNIEHDLAPFRKMPLQYLQKGYPFDELFIEHPGVMIQTKLFGKDHHPHQ